MSVNAPAHMNGDCRPSQCTICEHESTLCERCDAQVEEHHCNHGRVLCEGHLHECDDCQVEFAESLAYDGDRDEARF